MDALFFSKYRAHAELVPETETEHAETEPEIEIETEHAELEAESAPTLYTQN